MAARDPYEALRYLQVLIKFLNSPKLVSCTDTGESLLVRRSKGLE